MVSLAIVVLCVTFIWGVFISTYHEFRYEVSYARFLMYERLAPDIHWRLCMGGFTDERFRDVRAFRRKHGLVGRYQCRA